VTYKSIVLVASGAREDEHCFAAAARLAARCGAQVRVIPAFPDPAANLVYYGAVLNRAANADAIEQVQRGEVDAQSRLEALAQHVAANEGLKLDAEGVGAGIVVEKRDLMPAIAVAEAAVASDLVILGGEAARAPLGLGALFAETLLSTRAPILLVRDRHFPLEAAAIAWDGSAQAGRAVRAALPLLAQVQRIVILQHRDDLDWEAGSVARPERLIAYLARHGVGNVRIVAVTGDDVAAGLLEGARRERCDLLVAGAYGRPRLYELMLGGTTRSLVSAEGGPHILLAH
jgi:nucleotide-binding universal stress UspA family protein